MNKVKFEIIVKKKQGEKQVSVSVDKDIADLLENCSAEVRQTYLEGEYHAQLKNRAETRRHISLDKCLENGREFPSLDDSPIDEIVKKEEGTYVKELLDKLTEKQREVFKLHAFEGWTLEKIGEKMGVSFQCVHEIYHAAIKKLKKFLKIP